MTDGKINYAYEKAIIFREYFYNILLAYSNKKEIKTLTGERLRVNGLRERQRRKYYSSLTCSR